MRQTQTRIELEKFNRVKVILHEGTTINELSNVSLFGGIYIKMSSSWGGIIIRAFVGEGNEINKYVHGGDHQQELKGLNGSLCLQSALSLITLAEIIKSTPSESTIYA